MSRATAAASLPDLINVLKGHVSADMAGADITANELIDHLDLAWCVAERWRLEQYDLDQLDADLASEPPRQSLSL